MQQLARWVSRILHPFVVLPLAVLIARARHASAQAAATPAGGIALLMILPLLAFIVYRVRQGAWSDHDVSRPEQRRGLYRAMAVVLPAGTLAAWYCLPSLRAGLVAGWSLLLASMLANRWLKTS